VPQRKAARLCTPKLTCEFPEEICASEVSNELGWVSGMFYWIKQVQSFDNYIDKINRISKRLSKNGEFDRKLVMSIDCIVKTGSDECESAEDMTDRLTEVMNLITTLDMPTAAPTISSSPSASPTGTPILRPTGIPTETPTYTPGPSSSPNIFSFPSRQDVDATLKVVAGKQGAIVSELLTPRVDVDDENLYSFERFLSSLRVLADGTVQGAYFYVGHSVSRDPTMLKRGLINIAAFLAHAKTVAIYDSICDEQNVDGIDGKFSLSNSCGMHGITYQNLRCADGESLYECPPDPNLQMTAVTPLTRTDPEDGPPPFFCGPKQYFPFMGHYDRESNTVSNDAPFANRAGRTDVQSCCFWARGSGQVKGACLYGKLNYYFGKRAAAEGRRSLFPSVDFCQNPQAICSGQYSYSLMWITGMFAWTEVVQSHTDYSTLLGDFVEGQLEDDEFIDALSVILGSKEASNFKSNFKSALAALGLRS